jgi:molecular chaperone GrpE
MSASKRRKPVESGRDGTKPAPGPHGLEGGRPPAQADAAEPAGEQDPRNEAEREEAIERPEPVEEAPARSRSAAAEAATEPEQPEPEDPRARAERERDEYLALAQRAQADFENYRKRAAKEAAAAGERAKGNLVRELLPVVDNLERALASAGDEEQHLAEGVRLVHSELLAVLERSGVEAFDPSGETFDPTVHEALSTRSENGADPGVVLEVVEKGYKLNGAVLRPARVIVSA